jgi:uncharacterized protein
VSAAALPPPLTGLLEPAAYAHRPASVELRETHISWVLLAGERAFKLKKPLRLPFLDYGTLDRRHELCREEVRLNSRLAPDVYRGVRAVVPLDGGLRIAAEDDPAAIEYAVEMRRYADDATLDRRLAAGAAAEPEVQRVARRLARFHRDAAIPPEPERALPALEAMLDENFATLGELAVDPAVLDDARRLVDAFLTGRRAELAERARSGCVRAATATCGPSTWCSSTASRSSTAWSSTRRCARSTRGLTWRSWPWTSGATTTGSPARSSPPTARPAATRETTHWSTSSPPSAP